MLRIKKLILESVEEMRYKVSWPLYSELQRSSVMVLAASFIFALVIGLIDLVLKNAIAWIYNAL